MLTTNLSENCLNCAIGIALKLGAIFGLPFFSIKCDHNGSTLKSKIFYSKYYLFTGLLTFILLMYYTINGFIQLSSTEFDLIRLFDFLFILPHFVIYLCSTVTIGYAIIRVKIIEKAYTSFQLTMENWRIVTSKVLLSREDIGSLRLRTFVYIIVITTVMVVTTIASFCFDTKSNMTGIDRFGRLLTFYVIMVVMFILTVIDDYFKLVSRNFHSYLKIDLESKFNFAIDEFLIRGNTLFNEKLILNRKNLVATYTQLHARLIFSFLFMNQFLNPLVLLWVFGFTISITVNCYLVLTAFLDNYMNLLKATMIMIEFEAGWSVALIFFIAIRNSELRSVNDNIISYLNKYPINKMSTTAANQLEFLITTLNAQRATLNCLDIMTIGLPLIASVLGTVITYVIIALQFQVIFTRKLYQNATLSDILRPSLN